MPGNQEENFVLTSSVVPGIRNIAFLPNVEDIKNWDIIPDDWFAIDEQDPQLFEKEDLLNYNVNHMTSYKTKTVAPMPPPINFVPPDYALIIKNYLQESLSSGWITDTNLANFLDD